MKQPIIFGVRHLSPAGAWHLRKLLDRVRPKLILVEGPSDFTAQIPHVVCPETKPPLAILAYSTSVPIRTILYPFAEYSPEYQALLWAHENEVECRFFDLPSDVFLALSSAGKTVEIDKENSPLSIYERLDQQSGDDGQESMWERLFEHTAAVEAYHEGAGIFGAQLRELSFGRDDDWPETVVRESFMQRCIHEALGEGFAPEEIVVVTGAFHVEGLKTAVPMCDKELSSLPRVEANYTLMPYSYYRLSSRSGYGAGNKAPAYYSLLWESLQYNQPGWAARSYLTRIAVWQRANGNPVSSAEVIEGVRLAYALADLRGSAVPALRDLRDAAITCLGHGNLSEISLAVADTEIGTAIGMLPEGVSRTSIQQDFYYLLKEKKLEKYRTVIAQELPLDLRENRQVKSEKAAFLDLERSFFLHRLRVLRISFVEQKMAVQDRATWSELWVLRWTPEAEIELVEAALQGDTILQAVAFVMKERVEKAAGIAALAAVIEDAYTCGMPEAVYHATVALQALAVEAAALDELAETIRRLSLVVQYGSLRRLDSVALQQILEQLFLRVALVLPGQCVCDDNGAKTVIQAIDQVNAAALAHDFLDTPLWVDTLTTVAERDDLNTVCSGFAAAVLLERGVAGTAWLSNEVQCRLSRGVPADLGAGWFEGLAMKNRYALITRLSLWESLSEYIDTLDQEEFKRALVFLRRAFADFSAKEKHDIAENLGEIWCVDARQVSELLNTPLDQKTQQAISGLDDFDFTDI